MGLLADVDLLLRAYTGYTMQNTSDSRLLTGSEVVDRLSGVVACLVTLASMVDSLIRLARYGFHQTGDGEWWPYIVAASLLLLALAPFLSWTGLRRYYPLVGSAYGWTIAAAAALIMLLFALAAVGLAIYGNAHPGAFS